VTRLDSLRVAPGRPVRLSRFDPSDTSAFPGGKEKAEGELERLRVELDRLQELLYADHRFSVLIVLQGMDTAGKDGVIRHVFEGVNPQGVEVAGFQIPTPLETDHDFLWRVHPHAPARGHMAIFNRSHYEDVLVARVHRTVPDAVWEKRYRAIVDFERNLIHEGTTVLKFHLHLSRAEQLERLRARAADPTKLWKLSESDLHERAFWPAYMAAYERALARTTTEVAPWWVVPSDHKWFRNWVVSKVLVDALEGLGLRYPKGTLDPRKVRAALAR
jgi:PPK2 family polyphosphate:nucleotide phosphotransferase